MIQSSEARTQEIRDLLAYTMKNNESRKLMSSPFQRNGRIWRKNANGRGGHNNGNRNNHGHNGNNGGQNSGSNRGGYNRGNTAPYQGGGPSNRQGECKFKTQILTVIKTTVTSVATTVRSWVTIREIVPS